MPEPTLTRETAAPRPPPAAPARRAGGAVRLNLGCGHKRRDGFVGVDRYPCDAAEVLCDLARRLPFATSSVEELHLDNVIEHVLDIPALVREIVRVARPGARVTVVTPHFSSLSSWRDPTHVHHLAWSSMDHFAKRSTAHYVGGGLAIVSRRLSFGGGLGLLGRAVFAVAPELWEKQLAFVLRASTLTFVLRVEK